ncbi:MAG: hypothetical protein IJM23_05665 [Lachnospiraceae bacterium]|nr:hypothetical protein [Lachnospiraceae bacterium]
MLWIINDGFFVISGNGNMYRIPLKSNTEITIKEGVLITRLTIDGGGICAIEGNGSGTYNSLELEFSKDHEARTFYDVLINAKNHNYKTKAGIVFVMVPRVWPE